MKYIWIIVAIAVLVRIDLVLNLIDRSISKFQDSPKSSIPVGEVTSTSEIVPISNDLTLKATPRKQFLSMLESFNQTPDAEIQIKAMEIFKMNPTMFSETLDTELENVLYKWREHLIQKNKLAHNFLMELMNILKGENLAMLRRFYSLGIDVDMLDFLTQYHKSADSNCLIMSQLGDRLPDEEKYNELSERLVALDAVVSEAKTDQSIKAFGLKCLVVLKMEVDRLKSILPPEDYASESQAPVDPNASIPASAPVITPEQAVPPSSPPVSTGTSP